MSLLSVVFCRQVVACIACLVDNTSQEKKEGWDYGDGKWYIQPSIGAFADNFSRVSVWQGILHSIAVSLCLCDLVLFRLFLNKRGDELDFDTIRPSHFTVWVQSLSPSFSVPELVEFISKHGRGQAKTAEIYSVNVPFDIGEYISSSRKLAKLKAQQLLAQEYMNANGKEPRKCCRRTDLEAIERQLAAIEKSLADQQTRFSENPRKLQIGQIFITFSHQTDARAVAMNWNRSSFSTFVHWLCECCFSRPVHFQKSYFYANLAPEPSDIMWENLNVKWVLRLYRRVVTWVVMILVFAGSFFLCIFIKGVQKSWLEDHAQDNKDNYNRFKLFSFLLSISIVFINQAMGIVARLLTEQEKHQTWTDYYLSVAYKLCIFQVLNSTVLLIVINTVTLQGWEHNYTWWTPNGLVNDVLNLMYVECTIGPLTYIFSPRHYWKLLKRFLLERKARAGYITLTQSEANE